MSTALGAFRQDGRDLDMADKVIQQIEAGKTLKDAAREVAEQYKRHPRTVKKKYLALRDELNMPISEL